MSNKKMAYLYLTITLCAWGSLYVVSKFVLDKIPTFTVLFIRYFIAALTGTYIIIGGSNGNGHALGILLSVISVILWSLMTVMVRKITQKYDPIQITTYAIIVAAIFSFPFSTYEFIVIPNIDLFNPTIILSLLYIGLVCTALSHVLWNKSLSMIEAGSCSLFYPIQPMVSVLLGWLLLGENITMRFALGAILIISGILFSVVGNQNKEISTKKSTQFIDL